MKKPNFYTRTPFYCSRFSGSVVTQFIGNLLCIESPSGVGFSYNEDGNYTTGDTQTAEDNLAVAKGFFELFPDYASSPLFVGGGIIICRHYNNTTSSTINGTRFIDKHSWYYGGNPSFNYTTDAQYYMTFIQNLTDICKGSFYPEFLSLSASSSKQQQTLNQENHLEREQREQSRLNGRIYELDEINTFGETHLYFPQPSIFICTSSSSSSFTLSNKQLKYVLDYSHKNLTNTYSTRWMVHMTFVSLIFNNALIFE
ncbi:hypothetical protein DFA_09993 [Cavenderia fasciculata]|uniref:Uncharacterized protein n=1 Tax=Cavenderia fasciculata TaxID=261658 RepID=F4Q8Z8_CACFS|nr:uncharacterized protein DFA_09993 [Cavenderia fasciculata]EGG15167.1 hypothetical protein DFA_09993 [Cavenderia fasciculata]|eukprot:XP_004351887.1 hypothetical protein DFA_09993 [Cavenderia fasciculata]